MKFRLFKQGVLAVVSLCGLWLHAAESLPVPEKCGVIFENETGTLENRILPSVTVFDLSDSSAFSLSEDAPDKVKAIQCGRTSLVPHRNDYKVLVAGFPFSIVSGDRVGVLEAQNGRLRFNMLSGEMTDEEITLIGEFLDSAQLRFNQEGVAP